MIGNYSTTAKLSHSGKVTLKHQKIYLRLVTQK